MDKDEEVSKLLYVNKVITSRCWVINHIAVHSSLKISELRRVNGWVFYYSIRNKY